MLAILYILSLNLQSIPVQIMLFRKKNINIYGGVGKEHF